MDTPPTAIIDACVLYSAPVRDLVVRLAQAGLLQARWTDEIHEEWMRNVLKNNPRVSRERLERTRSLMDAAVRDCLVTGYSDLIDSLTLPDPDDRHVLAAAIHAGAGVIVTFNLSDFPPAILAPHGVEARHPDELFSELLDAAVDEFCAAVRLQRQSSEKPADDGGGLSREVGRGGITADGCSIEKLRGPALILSSESESRPLHGHRDPSGIERAVSWNTGRREAELRTEKTLLQPRRESRRSWASGPAMRRTRRLKSG